MNPGFETSVPFTAAFDSDATFGDLASWLNRFLHAVDPEGDAHEWFFTDTALQNARLKPLMDAVAYPVCFVRRGVNEGYILHAGFLSRVDRSYQEIATWKSFLSSEHLWRQAGLLSAALEEIMLYECAPCIVEYFDALKKLVRRRYFGAEEVHKAAGGPIVLLKRAADLDVVAQGTGEIIWSTRAHSAAGDRFFVEASVRDWEQLLNRFGVDGSAKRAA